MRRPLAVLLWISLLLAAGCDFFISRGGEGQPCFSETGECAGDLICYEKRCVRELPDAGQDGGDVDVDGGTDAGDDGSGGDDGGGDGPDVGPVHIYRSVGPGNGEPLLAANNGPNLVISGHTATFPVDLPPNVGVGDVIQYDTGDPPDGVPDSLAFIRERVDIRTCKLAAVDGNLVDRNVDTATWEVLRAYTSLYDAVTMEENLEIHSSIWDFDDTQATDNPRDLVARNTVWNIACYADGVDDSLVSIHFWVTDESHYLRIFTPVGPPNVGAGTSQRHSGIWTNDAYRLEVSFDADDRDVVQVNSNFVHIDGLQIHKTSDTGTRPVQGIEIHGTTNLWLSNSIIRGGGSEGQGVFLESSEAVLYMWNTIIYNAAETSGDGIFVGVGAQAFIYNVTLYNNNRGIYVAGNVGTNLFVKNVVAVGNSDYDFDSDATFGAGSTNNCSSDPTAGGGGLANGVTGVLPANVFESPTIEPPNLHLKSDSTCNGAGINLKDDPDLGFLDDIDGDHRPGLGLWDIGADENGL